MESHMKLAILMLAAMLPLSACIVVPDHDRDRPHVEDRDHHDDHDRDHCDRDHDEHCDHYH